ncbi:predicted protein [Naegleria gruberi]|uniref:Predicted protein n=1 Tax=Naegleria gruberi TaxID=5762 RepID=D2V0M2_NAEGR|nr:uncharacterized protein NAEGRDRAFT_78055 [Naegleria gruberi]EFC49747.1 predicted protein [Naegleria gruberi]|eukprot:XP_002682491.1 predicted protein [Naegleria gruberi strain NEG-M]
MMHSTGTTNTNFVRKDLISRNNIYYLVTDVLKHEELGMNDVITKYNMRTVISTNYAADPLWAKLQTYDPSTHEPIPRNTTPLVDHSSTSSSVESYSPQPRQEIPSQPTTISTTRVETIPTSHIPTTITTSTTQPQQIPPQPTTPTPIVSIPSIANAHLSPQVSSSTPHIAKSFRSPPPSDYFVNNAANLSYLSISQYFKLPLHEACVALRVDESSLKKRCRELGIRRWPYRKRCNITSGKNTQAQQVEESSASGDQLFSCFQLNKGKSPVAQKMKSEEALALEALDKLHNVNRSASNTTTTTTPVPSTTSSTSAPTTTSTTVQQQPTTHGVVAHQPPRPVPQPTTGTAYSYPPYPPHPGYPHMYPPHPGYHYPYGVPPPTHDGSQPVPYPMYYPPQTSVPPPGAYPPQPTESKDGQPQQPPYVPPYYYDYRYSYPQSGTVPPYPYPPQPGYSYPPHPDQATYPYPPHGYPMAYPPHQMGYPPQPVPPQQKLQSTPVIVSTSPAESQPVTGTPCRTVSSSTSTGEQTPITPVGSPQTKMVYQRETKVLHPVRYKPPSPTETTAEIVAKIKRERLEEQEEAAKKVRRDIQIANPTCSKPVSSQTVQNGASIKVAEK